MNLKLLIGIYNNWYGKLKSNERRLFFTLVLVLVSSFYFMSFLKPALDDIKKLKKQQQENQNQLGMLNSQILPSVKTKLEIETKKQGLKDLKLKISDIESKLIGSSQQQQLLTEVIKNAQDLELDLESVKEDIKEEREGFVRLYIDLKFASNYKKVLTYIRSLESISSFVKIEEVGLDQSKSEPLATVEASLKLSALLSYAPNNQGQFSSVKVAQADMDALKRSPFTPRFITERIKRKKLKVTGITFRNNQTDSTAIIDGKIVKIGDQVEGTKIESILFNAVIIDNGVEKEVLKLEREKIL